ncbi:MAG: hypothetical protein GY757_39090 [bacterium]|nr:hypothetical protein [bacterium]
MNTRLIAVFLFCLTTVSCVIPMISPAPLTARRKYQHVKTHQRAPVADSNSEMAHIFFFRHEQTSFRGVHMIVYENSKKTGLVVNGSYIAWNTSAGEKTIFVKRGKATYCLADDKKCIFSQEGVYRTLYDSEKRESNLITINAKKGGVYFVSLDMNFFSEHELFVLDYNRSKELVRDKYEGKLRKELLSLMSLVSRPE